MAKTRRLGRNCIEMMEARVLLSTTVNSAFLPSMPVATPGVTASAITPDDTPAVSPFTPAQLRHFYGVDDISFNGTAGDGTGQTIAIVDAYDQPDLLDSTDPNFDNSDLHQFDVMFGLPDPPSFVKIDENGGTNLPTTEDSGWSVEESLDVEWAHAMAPAAKIVLVECNSASNSDLLQAGVVAAQNYPGVTAISMSFDTSEFGGETSLDGGFVSTATNPGITYVASTGDSGSSSTGYPSFSPNVVAVGGTAITTSDSAASYGSETVWNDSSGSTGGAPSSMESKPGYQSLLTPADGARDTPDVSFEASQTTGVYLYDSASNPSYHLYKAGGTSLSAPCWAGLIAVTDQGRAMEGLGALDGFTQTLPRLYTLASTDFHDITVGNNNGESAGAGYDLASGRGTPVARLLVPDLAGGDRITGRVFLDKNGDQIYDGTDTPFAGQTVYLDLNNNGVEDPGEPTAVTSSSGIYTFSDQIGSLTGTVRTALSGYVLDTASASFATNYDATQTVNLSLFPIVYSTAVAGSAYVVRLDSTGTTDQISINGVLNYSAPISIINSLSFSLTGSGDSLTVDGTNGNPVPTGGISFNGGAAGDLLAVIGTANGNDSFNVSSNALSFGSNPINFANVSSLTLNPGTGIDSLAVASGSVVITPQSPGLGILTRSFSSLSVSAGASASFATAAMHSDRMVVVASSLSVLGKLDLGGNDMIVHRGIISTFTAKLATGFANGNWNGSGIASAAAAADTSHLTAIGVVSNNLGGGNTLYNSFDGQAVVSTDILLKYTYYGDADLSGKIDGSDYSRIDSASVLGGTGWFNGDFNYDGAVNGSDYTLIDDAFNRQGNAL